MEGMKVEEEGVEVEVKDSSTRSGRRVGSECACF